MRRMSPENAAELELLKHAWLQLSAHLVEMGFFSPDQAALLPRIFDKEETRAPSMLLRGLREGMVDALEMTRDFSNQQIRATDERLASAGSATLSELRVRFWGQLPRLLSRKRLRNEFEYRVLMERLNDVSPESLTDEERQIADRLVAEYETRRR